MTPTEQELLAALTNLLRVTEGGEYDHKDAIMAHNNALRVIEKYSPQENNDGEEEDADKEA